MTSELRTAAKELREENKNIIIKKADKSSVFVIMNTIEYIKKLNNILKDETRFNEIKKDPTEKIKRNANNLIKTLNAKKKKTIKWA